MAKVIRLRVKAKKHQPKNDKDFIDDAISHKGALTERAKEDGRTVDEQAEEDKKKGTTLQKQQANFYLKVLKKVKR